ncbi:MAG TPA: chemotaxis protein CheX [Tepidisphaeraceae bacterium]|jgi:chemotaxis protein CheY-P-specific phosphatase CheC|nr:chemotaxis protein CheX [Tepidisphaeraceae bacterium]
MSNATDTENDIVNAFVDALETLAFISLAPSEDCSAPIEAILSTIDFAGESLRGRLCLIASESFGWYLAGNVLGTDPGDQEARDRGSDSLRELMNVACGTFCSKQKLAGKIELSLPHSITLDIPALWASALAKPGTHVFDADGHTIAFWMEELA